VTDGNGHDWLDHAPDGTWSWRHGFTLYYPAGPKTAQRMIRALKATVAKCRELAARHAREDRTLEEDAR